MCYGLTFSDQKDTISNKRISKVYNNIFRVYVMSPDISREHFLQPNVV